MLVNGNEQLARRDGKIGSAAQETARARISQVEVQPQPAFGFLGDRPIHRKLLYGSVGF